MARVPLTVGAIGENSAARALIASTLSPIALTRVASVLSTFRERGESSGLRSGLGEYSHLTRLVTDLVLQRENAGTEIGGD